MTTPAEARLPRAKGLFVVRESDSYDLEKFDNMRDQTYRSQAHIPEVAAIYQLGLAVLSDDELNVTVTHPDGTHEEAVVQVQRWHSARCKNDLFYLGGYWHLWSRASAAVEKDGGNAFSDMLIEQISRLRPVELHAANFNRLIRSQKFGNLVQAAVHGNVDRLHVGPMTVTIAGSADEKRVGHLAFAVHAQMAAWDRDGILQRVRTGVVSSWRAGHWTLGERSIPFGYHLDNRKRLLPIPELQPQVREMLIVLAEDLPPSEAAQRLDAAGVLTPASNASEPRLYSTLTSISSALNTLRSRASLYLTGEYLLRLTVDFDGLTHVHGQEVMRYPDVDTDLGEIQLLHQPGVPPGGWAEPDVLDAVAAQIQARYAKLAATRGLRNRPLSSEVYSQSSDPVLLEHIVSASTLARFPLHATSHDATEAPLPGRRTISALTRRRWRDGPWLYELRVHRRNRYHVVRWHQPDTGPASLSVTGGQPVAGGRAETVAELDADRLLCGFVDAFITACQDGIPAEVLPGPHGFPGWSKLDHAAATDRQRDLLQGRIRTSKQQVDRATKNELAASDDFDRDRYRRAAQRAGRDLREAQSRLTDLNAQAQSTLVQPDKFDALADILLPALHRLRTCENRISRPEYYALQKVMPDFRLHHRDGAWSATATLAVPTTNGIATLGPVTWDVGSGGTGVANWRHAIPGYSDGQRREWRARLEQLGLNPAAARVAARHPLPHVPLTLLSVVDDVALPDGASPDWGSTPFINWLISVYADPDFGHQSQQRHRAVPLRQLVADYAAEHGTFTLAQAASDLGIYEASYLLQMTYTARANPRGPVIQFVENPVMTATNLLTGYACRCGQTANVVVFSAEVPGDLLCSCGLVPPGRSDDPRFLEDLRFPVEYGSLRLAHAEAAARVRDTYAKLKARPLRPSEQAIVDRIGKSPGGVRASTLAAELGVNTTSIYTTLRRLEARSWVEHHSTNPRVWNLTEAGRSGR